MKNPKLKTDIAGLILMPLSVEDSKALHALISENRDHLTKHGDYNELKESTLESTMNDLSAKKSDSKKYGVWYLDELVGRVDLIPRAKGDFVLGYWLGEDFTGRGFATAACKALIEFGRQHLRARDIYAGVTKGNVASEKVLERLGLKPIKDMGEYTRFHLKLSDQ